MPAGNHEALNLIIRAQDRTAAAFQKVNKNTEQVSRRLERLEKRASSVGNALRTALGAVTAGVGVGQVASLADEYTNLQNKLKVVTSSTEELASVSNKLFDISQRTRTELSATTTVYSRLALQAGDLGLTQGEMLKITERLNQAIIVGGSTATEASNAMIQLSQGLASGALRGDELRSVLEQLPVVAQLIAREMGVTVGELRELGAEGKISADIVAKALLDADDVAEKYSKTVSTLGQAFVILRNQAVRYTGEVGETTGAINAAVNVLKTMTLNFGYLANGIGAAGIGLVTYFGASVLASVKSGLVALSVAIGTTTTALGGLRIAFGFLLGPLGVALTAAGAAMAYFGLETAKAARQAEAINRVTDDLVNKFQKQINIGEIDTKDAVAQLEALQSDIKTKIANIDSQLDTLKAKRDSNVLSSNKNGLLSQNTAVFDNLKIKEQLEQLKTAKAALQTELDGVNGSLDEFTTQIESAEAAQKRAQQATDSLGEATKKAKTNFDDYLATLSRERELIGASESEKLRAQLTQQGLNAILKQYGEISDEHRAKLLSEVEATVAATEANDKLTASIRARAEAAKKVKDLVVAQIEINKLGGDAIQQLEQRINLQGLINEGKTAEARAIEVINGLHSQGVFLTDAQIDKIHELIGTLVQLEEQNKKAKKASKEASDPGPWERYVDSLKDVKTQLEETAANAFIKMEDALVTFVETGKLNFKSLTDSIIADLSRIALRRSIVGPLANLFGGIPGFSGGGPVQGFAKGGLVQASANTAPVQQFASGGPVFGRGTSTSDSIPARLSNGEYVINAASTKRYRPLLDSINNGGGVMGNTMNVIINNNAPVEIETQETTRSNGVRQLEVFIEQTVTKSLLGGSGARVLERGRR